MLRKRLDLTQRAFAEPYFINIDALQNWEQGRAQLDSAASALLHLIAFNPEQVASTLQFIADKAYASS
jgi:putative transcriptional regulator